MDDIRYGEEGPEELSRQVEVVKDDEANGAVVYSLGSCTRHSHLYICILDRKLLF